MSDSIEHDVGYALSKIAEYVELKDGWYYGEGHPPSKEIVFHAVEALHQLINIGFSEFDVAPGVDGEIQLVADIYDFELEFTIEQDCTVTFSINSDGHELFSMENVDYEDALTTIKDYITCSGLDFSKNKIIWSERGDFPAWLSKIVQGVEYPSSTNRVWKRGAELFVTTSGNITRNTLMNPQFFGYSINRKSPPTALSSRMHPTETPATIISKD